MTVVIKAYNEQERDNMSTRLMYTRKYADEAEMDADHQHLKQVLAVRSDVSGSVYREQLTIMLHADAPINFDTFGSIGWELTSERQYP